MGEFLVSIYPFPWDYIVTITKKQYSSGGEVALDQLVMGDPVLFLPQYGTSHVQLTQDLIQEAG